MYGTLALMFLVCLAESRPESPSPIVRAFSSNLTAAIEVVLQTAAETVDAILDRESETAASGSLPAPGQNTYNGRYPFKVVASILGSTVKANKLSWYARVLDTAVWSLCDLGMPIDYAVTLLSRISEVRGTVSARGSGRWKWLTACPFSRPFYPSLACLSYLTYPYRTFNGMCNNFQQPLLGSSMTPLARFQDPDYSDGMQAPRQSSTGDLLPSARNVSIRFFRPQARHSFSYTHYLMIFGQFLDHDLSRTAITKIATKIGGEEKLVDVSCGEDGCSGGGVGQHACLPIEVPEDDPDFNTDCLMFVRSQQVTSLDCQPGNRQQLNQLTHYLDASQVYGSTQEEAEGLRVLDKERGRLATSDNPEALLKPLLPKLEETENGICRQVNETVRCFKAGDGRVNENVGLASIHTVFVRFHNHVEDTLHSLFPAWTGERLYQETRKIVGATWQRIIYHEYLPVILGPDLIRDYKLGLASCGFVNVYDQSVNPSVANVFATAAFRFAHSMISDTIHFSNQEYTSVETVNISETMRNPSEMYKNSRPGHAATDSITLGLIDQQAPLIDLAFSEEVTSKLFSVDPKTIPGTDLISLNIQRGRDHGIPGYTKWREWCNLSVPSSFDDFLQICDEEAVRNLKSLYKTAEDVDLFAGAMCETPVPSGMVGPTFGCILGQQFSNLKFGDRFWHENARRRSGFTKDQLTEIRKFTLSKIICLTLDSVNTIQKFVLLHPFKDAFDGLGAAPSAADVSRLVTIYKGNLNEREPCSSLPDIDLSKWGV